VKLHANVFNYRISRFYTRVMTRTAHEYYTQTTRILRACRCCNPFDRYCTILLGFLLFRNFVKKLSCLIEILVLWGIYLWRKFIEEMIPSKVKGRTVRLCIVWKVVSERNFPESSIKCSTFVIPLRNQSLEKNWSVLNSYKWIEP